MHKQPKQNCPYQEQILPRTCTLFGHLSSQSGSLLNHQDFTQIGTYAVSSKLDRQDFSALIVQTEITISKGHNLVHYSVLQATRLIQ